MHVHRLTNNIFVLLLQKSVTFLNFFAGIVSIAVCISAFAVSVVTAILANVLHL